MKHIKSTVFLALLVSLVGACEGHNTYYVPVTPNPDGGNNVETGTDADADVDTGPIRFVVMGISIFENTVQNTATMIEDQINAAGGLLGRDVEVLFRNEPETPQEVLESMQAILDDDEPYAVSGPVEPQPSALLEPFAEAEVFNWAITSGFDSDWNKQDPVWSFSSQQPEQDFVCPSITLAKEVQGCSTVGIFFETREKERASLQAGWEAAADAQGVTLGPIVFIEAGATPQESDYAPFEGNPVDCLISSPVAAVYSTLYYPEVANDEDVKFVFLGWGVPLELVGQEPGITTDDMEPYFNGAVYLDPSNEYGPAVVSWVEEYEARFGPFPETFSGFEIGMAGWYDGIAMFALAIEHAGTTNKDRVRESVYTITGEQDGDMEILTGDVDDGLAAIRAGNGINYNGGWGLMNFEEGNGAQTATVRFGRITDIKNLLSDPQSSTEPLTDFTPACGE